ENSAELLAADGKVNINLGEGGSFTGAFIQDKPLPGLENLNIATTTLRLGNGSVWNLTKASTLTEATFGAGSSLVIDGTKFTGENADYAITGKVSMEPTANLIINNSAPDTNYKVVKGENNISDSNLSYDRTALVAVEKTDNVYEVEFKSIANANESELSAAQDKAVAANGGSNLVAPGIISGSISSSASSETKALGRAIMQMAGTAEQKAAILNDIAQIGEKAGNTTNAVNIINNVTGITNQRMSFTNINTAPQGGHGKVERKYKSGAGVWAQYMHGKDKVEDLPGAGSTTSSYESQYNGAVIGYDFKEVGKTKTGISFNYGEGDSHSKDAAVKTNNDFDFWGVGLYHSIMNEDTNLIFDINYNKTDADVTQVVPGYGNITVNPNTTAISAGVRAEKLIQNGPVQIVPYVGARFLSIDTDEYTSSAGIKYSPDRQNIWLVPVGVSLRQENNYENGWKVTPKADLSYIWALGDTDSSMNVATGVKVDNLAYTVMDNGSFLGTVGIEASKGDWTYGLSYSYQKGEYQRSDKWFVDVRYSF
ncbi:MAG: autotransporter outer membrane beta-barrel domain-containing protein, partial [Phascolarctobacterium sp.]